MEYAFLRINSGADVNECPITEGREGKQAGDRLPNLTGQEIGARLILQRTFWVLHSERAKQ